MLKLHETVVVPNPAEALRLESGVFNVTSPTGDTFRVICRPGHRMVIDQHRFLPEMKRTDLVWRIQKVSGMPYEPEQRKVG